MAEKTLPGQTRVIVNEDGETVLTVEESSNGKTDSFSLMFSLLNKAIDEKEQEFLAAQKHYQEVSEELRRLRQMHKYGTGEQRQETKRPPAGTKTGKGVSVETADKVRAALATHEEPTTVAELVKETGLAKERVRSAVNYLREEGKVRLTGSKRLSGLGRESNFYLITPNGRA